MDREEVNKEKDAKEQKLFETNIYTSLTNCYSVHHFIKITVYLKPLP